MRKKNKTGFKHEDVRPETKDHVEAYLAKNKKRKEDNFSFTIQDADPELIVYIQELRRTRRLSIVISNLLKEHWRLVKARHNAMREAEKGVNE